MSREDAMRNGRSKLGEVRGRQVGELGRGKVWEMSGSNGSGRNKGE